MKMFKGLLVASGLGLMSVAATAAFAGPGEKALANLKEAIFIVGGYPSDVYSVEWPNADEAPAKEGLTGVVDALGVGVQAAATAAGATSCESVPTEGSQTVTITLKGHEFQSAVTFVAPTLTVPAGLTGAGSKFSAAANVVVTFNESMSMKGHVEWLCSHPVAVAVTSVPGPTLAGTTQLINVFVDHTTPSAEIVEFSQVVTSTATPANVWDSQIAHLVKDSSTGDFHFYEMMFFNRASSYSGDVYDGTGGQYQTEQIQISGNRNKPKFSGWRRQSKTGSSDISAVNGTEVKPTAVGTATSDFSVLDTSASTTDVRGCVDGEADDASVAGDCDGYALQDTPPNAIVGASLTFSLNDLRKLAEGIIQLP